ncbi:MAG: Crotonobetainyl-CoA dehydrogenase [Pseudomonadales bacterium]|nr:Crotonobetainyl-CoA dehydrogenase [Pseudomonadales bacterium]
MGVRDWPASPRSQLGVSGAEPPLPPMIAEFQQTLRRFALEVVRPLGMRLDRMSAGEVIAPGSPFWEFHRKYRELGIGIETLRALSPEDLSLMFPILFEELGYGDAGLAISAGASTLPLLLAYRFDNGFLLERFSDSQLGCWGITEPDHGSDQLDPSGQLLDSRGRYGKPNCVATLRGDRIVINGQKSAWVSNGPVAEICILYCAADTGSGPDPSHGCVLVIPLDLPGVSRGKPLDKMGQRALPQGEIFFDNVEVGRDYLLAGPEDYQRAVYCIHSEANGLMGGTFAGLAQAAFDLALDYAHERRQGGVPIIRHQSVQHRLFHMYRKIEAARALTRRVILYNNTAPVPALQAAMTSKVTGTQTSFEVASEALQLFGGNGLTREYPLEKLLRDARASLIEDGCNEILAIKGGCYLIDEARLR